MVYLRKDCILRKKVLHNIKENMSKITHDSWLVVKVTCFVGADNLVVSVPTYDAVLHRAT